MVKQTCGLLGNDPSMTVLYGAKTLDDVFYKVKIQWQDVTVDVPNELLEEWPNPNCVGEVIVATWFAKEKFKAKPF